MEQFLKLNQIHTVVLLYTYKEIYFRNNAGTYDGPFAPKDVQYKAKLDMWDGTHPCVYVRIPKGRTLHGLGYDEAGEYLLSVHGGLTYAEGNLSDVTNDDESWFLGLDYGHCWDYAGYFMRDKNSYVESHMKKRTTEEIVNECKEVCEAVHALWKANGEVND